MIELDSALFPHFLAGPQIFLCFLEDDHGIYVCVPLQTRSDLLDLSNRSDLDLSILRSNKVVEKKLTRIYSVAASEERTTQCRFPVQRADRDKWRTENCLPGVAWVIYSRVGGIHLCVCPTAGLLDRPRALRRMPPGVAIHRTHL